MTQLTRGLWENRDEHMIEEKATSTVRTVLLRWPERARARCGELRCRRAPGESYEGWDDDRGEVWQAGKRSRKQQRRGRDAERVGRMPARLDERGHRVNSDLRPS